MSEVINRKTKFANNASIHSHKLLGILSAALALTSCSGSSTSSPTNSSENSNVVAQEYTNSADIIARKLVTGPEEARESVLQDRYDAEAMRQADEEHNKADYAMQLSLNESSFSSNSTIHIRLVDASITGIEMENGLSLAQNWDAATPDKQPSYLSVQDSSVFANALQSTPATLPSGTKTITPFVYKNGDVAWTTDQAGQTEVPVKVVADSSDPKYGFILAQDYRVLGGPSLGMPYVPDRKTQTVDTKPVP
jgi:hypothetical protein